MDEHIALRVRSRRRELGISQRELAQSLGLSYQQVQKYEAGKDRIGAARYMKSPAVSMRRSIIFSVA
ncbi:MAG TPA: helix-turn-helix transcriptional regulator [Rhizomicrobium sp.]|nr:helix-turn-helix transcriptional regulator [Rhizomicrobium sp.]